MLTYLAEAYFYNLDTEELREIQLSLDMNWRVVKSAKLSDVQAGWRWAECGGKIASCVPDLSAYRAKYGRVLDQIP